MEENSIRIKKKYVYSALILILLAFGYSAYILGAKSNRPAPAQSVMMDQGSNSMADHHKPAQSAPSGFFNDAVGKQAPDFELQDIGGNPIQLSDYTGKNVVLFFSEGSMCYPSCWNQIASLGNDGRMNNGEVVSFSIVVDSAAQWQKIIQKVPQMSNSKILFDTEKKASMDYDVLYAGSSMHKGSYPGHTYIIIDKKGVIRYIKDDPRMAINNDEIARELQNIDGV